MSSSVTPAELVSARSAQNRPLSYLLRLVPGLRGRLLLAPARGMMPHLRVRGYVPPSTLASAAGVHRRATLLGRRRALVKINRSMRLGPARNGVSK